MRDESTHGRLPNHDRHMRPKGNYCSPSTRSFDAEAQPLVEQVWSIHFTHDHQTLSNVTYTFYPYERCRVLAACVLFDPD